MDGKKKLALTFAFYEGDQLVRRETVTQDIVKVGKDPKSHLRVEDDVASRMHAVIEVQSDITLIDLGNEAGTLVNGARVNKCKLNEGDQIQIGSTVIKLETVEEAGGAVAAAAPAPPPPKAKGDKGNPFSGGASPNPFAVAASPFGGDNPFASPTSGVADDAPEGTYEYQVVKSGPEVPSEEVEGLAEAVEVRVSWGRNLLHVEVLQP
ncbi:MAG: FHA domain-containing protein, partial [Myxococcota bacterium]